jgi:hypothetical protein
LFCIAGAFRFCHGVDRDCFVSPTSPAPGSHRYQHWRPHCLRVFSYLSARISIGCGCLFFHLAPYTRWHKIAASHHVHLLSPFWDLPGAQLLRPALSFYGSTLVLFRVGDAIR